MAQGPIITLGSVLEKYKNLTIMALRKNLADDESIASRKLIQSISGEIKIFGNTWTWELRMEDYWENVEDGRGLNKKMHPIEDIEKWITLKGIPVLNDAISKGAISSLKNKTVRKGIRQKTVMDNRRRMAWGIAKDISKRGIRPTHFYSKVINDAFKNNLRADISKALKKDFTLQIIEAAKEKK